jgi:hypothetical protein
LDDNCDGERDNVESGAGVLAYTDSDGDGYGDPTQEIVVCELTQGLSEEGGDCDDADPQVKPTAQEICNGIDDDCDGLVDQDDNSVANATYWLDVDGDTWGDESAPLELASCEAPARYALRFGDCDDDDPSVNPDAEEICGGGDEDCDGLANDEDSDVASPTWYADLDRDGFGDEAQPFQACSPPLGYVDNDADCDDTDETIRPGAEEVCDTQDQDCDGDVDENAADQLVWYEDGDGDGWGDESSVKASCVKPAGYADQDGDCDDAASTVYPGAEESCGGGVDSNCDGSVDTDGDGDGFLACEDCNDADASINDRATEICNGVDDDCDGDVDDDDASISTASQSNWYRDADSDGFGDASIVTLLCDQPTGTVTDNTDCDDSGAGANPDLLEVCDDGGDNDCDGSTTDCTHGRGRAKGTWTGITAGDSAGQTLWAADYDGDGAMDLAIGAPDGDSLYIVYGSSTGGSLASEDTFSAASSGDGPGNALHAGDTNADGVTDLLIGAADGDAVYVLNGPPSTGGSLASADAVISGSDALGTGVRWVNNDGNGFLDAIVSAPETGSTLSPDEGTVYLFAGPVSGSLSVSSANATVEGSAAASLGGLLLGLDSDGDGQDESALSGNGGLLSTSGSLWLFASLSGSLDTSDADVEISDGDDLFAALASSDVDGDGYADLLIGDPAGSADQGAMYLFLGPINSDASVSSADATITGASGDGLGSALAIVPDLDGDSIDELWIGSSADSSATLWLGGSALSGNLRVGDAPLVLSGSTGSLGVSLAAGDIDGDGDPDLIASDPASGSNKGSVLFLAGGALPF